MNRTLIIAFLTLIFSCTNSGEEKQKKSINDNENNEEIKLIVKGWTEAHSKQDLKMLSRFYADSVIFYRNRFSKENCLKQKEIAFTNLKSKYSTEVFGDIDIDRLSNGNVICSFLKRVTIGSKLYDYYAYLVFRNANSNPKISIEGDYLTDFNSNQYENKNFSKETVKGDFNGDGKFDYVILSTPSNDSTNKEFSENIFLEFSEPKHRAIIPGSASGKLSNLGDLNNDGSDEIGFWSGWLHSSWSKYYVYTYKNGRWINAIPRFSTHIDQWNKGVTPVEKDIKNPKSVIIRYSSTINKDIKINSKSIPII